ncbi:hypothetical protein B0H13DRAFT_1872394 [Mycena leptocephala]|nr:hypothetical protein B0H13DRAFT_1872394 [Mycena leptocephala]
MPSLSKAPRCCLSLSRHPIVSGINQTDIVLGCDWAAFLRDSLLSLGNRVDSSFDAWRFVSYTTHPILNGAHTPYSIFTSIELAVWLILILQLPRILAAPPPRVLAFPVLPCHTLKITLKSQIIRPTHTMHHWR